MKSCFVRGHRTERLLVLITILAIATTAIGQPPDFLRDVRPVLSGHCFKCHGPDDKARKAKLRLDNRADALRDGKSGTRPIVPGKPNESELIRRIYAPDAEEVMPPPATKHPLTEAQKEILRNWIAGGAEYRPHWAFAPPKPPRPPMIKHADWPRNEIDYFVVARLEAEGLRPSPQADPSTLVRRLYLDLIGFPPTPEEADEFIRDASPDSYEKLVDRLLSSPHYGERWARRWLDLARYADTNGYEKDRRRSIWPYRDWVIDAINADLPFDQFTIEQLAGDMLPQASTQQRIATGFHRNTMLNEEGGIDPLEFRFYAMVDRVNTTATAWVGLTLGCAQCHTHKYDPITQREYYQFMAFLNNADEPELEVPNADIAARRAAIQSKIDAIVADLSNRFPVEETRWHVPANAIVESESGAKPERLDDGSYRLSGPNPDKDNYTAIIHSPVSEVSQFRLEAITDAGLPSQGPGRTEHGNFVLSEIRVSVAPEDSPDQAQPLKFVEAKADFSQKDFPVAHAIDGKTETGWAIQGPGQWNVNRAATFKLEKPFQSPKGSRWRIQLLQQHGKQHTLGGFRLSLGEPIRDDRPVEVRRREHLERKFEEWLEKQSQRVVRWTVLRPTEAKSNLPLLTVQEDDSVFVSGDQSKRDLYELKFSSSLKGITAIRLEALPDERLPKHGPGRVYYEGPFGDFFLSEFTLTADGKPVKLDRGTHSYASGKSSAQAAIDGNPHSGWTVNGGQGKAHNAVFHLAEPLPETRELGVKLLFEWYHCVGLGRFRISVATDPRPAEALDLPNDLQEFLLMPAIHRTAEQRRRLMNHYLTAAPELAETHQEIKKLRDQMPAFPTTLVMLERPPENPRPTQTHHRGEFLQPAERVEAGGLSALHELPKDVPRNRLTFARWLVSPENPLAGRVTMNRDWAAFFGRGLVRTLQDFGFQGELPTHPDLLDWLAVEFVKQGWSRKKMHKLIVMSATYRQSSAVTPELLEKDPENKLLARGPRFRIEAELVRDSILRMSGLLSPKLGGPSVFPPQPPGVTTEGAYGALEWKVSEGEDRYRRGLYTFSKRTAPYAMFVSFDAPSGEACVARREVSNSPLQSLTLLNDVVFFEAAQALGRMIASRSGSEESRAAYLFRRCLTRQPSERELAMLVDFCRAQKRRFETKELNAEAVAGPGEGDAVERAAWTTAARAVLNLDETITRP
ncbi:MAG: PSD1 domain-containing protein [Verrucomicrobia bacterium]|nr:PSD1 domain-containing protein [Verrucomicrobiota bacterium]